MADSYWVSISCVSHILLCLYFFSVFFLFFFFFCFFCTMVFAVITTKIAVKLEQAINETVET